MSRTIRRSRADARGRGPLAGPRLRTPYAACGWSVAFIAPHVYWAAGGTAGLPDAEPLRGAIAVINYAAIALSALAAVLALQLARAPVSAVWRRILLSGAWAASTVLGVRGAGGLMQGMLADGEWSERGSDALVIGFEALFLLGGVLFGLAARAHSRATR